jgi:hypothetical protein
LFIVRETADTCEALAGGRLVYVSRPNQAAYDPYPFSMDVLVPYEEPEPTCEEIDPIGEELPFAPRRDHNIARLNEIHEAIQAYLNAKLPLPDEWLDEYNDIVNRLNE